MKLKFGKKSIDIFNIKQNFFTNNDELLKKQKQILRIYKNQPKRKICKICKRKLQGEFFINHQMKYVLCNYCSHINGYHEDTVEFSKEVYQSDKINYSQTYKSNDLKLFKERQKNIYDPKVKFLLKNIKNLKKISVLDFGCGSGYLVSSLIDHGIKKVHGVEVSRSQISFGKFIFKKYNKNPNTIKHVNEKKILSIVSNTNAKCIILIGVLEHLVDPHDLMKKIKDNKNIMYVYLCVPMFSISCLIENSYEKVFNRLLGGGHTHLFTEKSLKIFMKKYKFLSIAEWWFGTDIMDLFRSFSVNLAQKSSFGLNKILNKFKLIIDDLQLSVDKKKMSSQVHIIFKKSKWN